MQIPKNQRVYSKDTCTFLHYNDNLNLKNDEVEYLATNVKYIKSSNTPGLLNTNNLKNSNCKHEVNPLLIDHFHYFFHLKLIYNI